MHHLNHEQRRRKSLPNQKVTQRKIQRSKNPNSNKSQAVNCLRARENAPAQNANVRVFCPIYSFFSPIRKNYSNVRISTPSLVTKTVCSKCAESEPSFIKTSHSLSVPLKITSPLPREVIGSIQKVSPS